MPETSHMPPPGGGMLGAVDRVVARVENLFNFVAALVIFLMMFFMVAEVLGRKLFNAPIPGAIDWIEVSMATFAFLGAAYCQRLNGHIRMDLLVTTLRGRLRWAIETTATAAAVFYVFVIMRRSFFHFLRAWDIGDSTIDVQLPVWPSKLIVPVALALLLIRLLIQLWAYLRLMLAPDAEPVAIPMKPDVDEITEAEMADAGQSGRGDPAHA